MNSPRSHKKKKVALLSVFDKRGIVEFAQVLRERGFRIIASGGTAKALKDAGVSVQDVAEFVGGGAILGHKVVTLSREVHAGLLADYIEEVQEMAKLNLPYIDLVCVDLYPLEREIAREGATRESVIKLTDVGGPTMLHSGAKGRRIVICDPADRQMVIDWITAGKPDEDGFITDLVAKAENTVGKYITTSGIYHGKGRYAALFGEKVATCKYGENAYQTPAALFSTGTGDPLALDKFELIAGEPMSYNNTCDLDRMLQTITHAAAGFDINNYPKMLIAIGVKHGNPCGAAAIEKKDGLSNDTLARMLDGDLLAIFGGLLVTNFAIGRQCADILLHYREEGEKRLLDGIVAPSYTKEAIQLLGQRHKCRLVANQALKSLNRESLDTAQRFRYVRGGLLSQPNYTDVLNFGDPGFQAYGSLTAQQRVDMILAWAIGCTSNSNTITLVHNGMLIGNGVGQQDRVGGAQLAVMRAKRARHKIEEAVAYSDSFFPFNDGIEVLAQAGVKVILATSGSRNDAEAREFCRMHRITLCLRPDKEGRGFFGH